MSVPLVSQASSQLASPSSYSTRKDKRITCVTSRTVWRESKRERESERVRERARESEREGERERKRERERGRERESSVSTYMVLECL